VWVWRGCGCECSCCRGVSVRVWGGCVGWWSLSGCWGYVRGDVGVGVEGVCVLCVYACVCLCVCV